MTSKVVLKCYVTPDIWERFKTAHPGYGEASRVLSQLVAEYVDKVS